MVSFDIIYCIHEKCILRFLCKTPRIPNKILMLTPVAYYITVRINRVACDIMYLLYDPLLLLVTSPTPISYIPKIPKRLRLKIRSNVLFWCDILIMFSIIKLKIFSILSIKLYYNILKCFRLIFLLMSLLLTVEGVIILHVFVKLNDILKNNIFYSIFYKQL